jgi:hypothetical protein
MYEKHFVEYYFISTSQEFIGQIHKTINWTTGRHVFKDYHSIHIYPWF